MVVSLQDNDRGNESISIFPWRCVTRGGNWHWETVYKRRLNVSKLPSTLNDQRFTIKKQRLSIEKQRASKKVYFLNIGKLLTTLNNQKPPKTNIGWTFHNYCRPETTKASQSNKESYLYKNKEDLKKFVSRVLHSYVEKLPVTLNNQSIQNQTHFKCSETTVHFWPIKGSRIEQRQPVEKQRGSEEVCFSIPHTKERRPKVKPSCSLYSIYEFFLLRWRTIAKIPWIANMLKKKLAHGSC